MVGQKRGRLQVIWLAMVLGCQCHIAICYLYGDRCQIPQTSTFFFSFTWIKASLSKFWIQRPVSFAGIEFEKFRLSCEKWADNYLTTEDGYVGEEPLEGENSMGVSFTYSYVVYGERKCK